MLRFTGGHSGCSSIEMSSAEKRLRTTRDVSDVVLEHQCECNAFVTFFFHQSGSKQTLSLIRISPERTSSCSYFLSPCGVLTDTQFPRIDDGFFDDSCVRFAKNSIRDAKFSQNIYMDYVICYYFVFQNYRTCFSKITK